MEKDLETKLDEIKTLKEQIEWAEEQAINYLGYSEMRFYKALGSVLREKLEKKNKEYGFE